MYGLYSRAACNQERFMMVAYNTETGINFYFPNWIFNDQKLSDTGVNTKAEPGLIIYVYKYLLDHCAYCDDN